MKDKPGYKGSIYIIWRVDGSEDHYAHDMFYDCALLLRLFSDDALWILSKGAEHLLQKRVRFIVSCSAAWL